jgi:general secretion pathway protein K
VSGAGTARSDRARPRSPRRERGVVLVTVLFFALLLTSTVATFLRKATMDNKIVRNREATARAEALARGGVELAKALLLEDRAQELKSGVSGNSSQDVWALANGQPLPAGDGASLRLRIEDSGARLNLNSVFQFTDAGTPNPAAEPLLQALIQKAIDDMALPPADKALYERNITDLAENLIDYVDPDDVRLGGGYEDDVYQRRNPPQHPANRPLLSVDELRRVEGFDARLVDALRPYVTVYPFASTTGINPNTAPPYVLALLFSDDGVGNMTLASEDTVRQILKARQDGGTLCGEAQRQEGCTPIRELVPNAIYPAPSWGGDVFTVVAEATVGEVHRSIEAVVDRRENPPLLLSWRVL